MSSRKTFVHLDDDHKWHDIGSGWMVLFWIAAIILNIASGSTFWVAFAAFFLGGSFTMFLWRDDLGKTKD